MTKDPARERVMHVVLENLVARHGNRTFLYFKDQAFGYRDFDQAAARVACGLQSLGINKGDKVAILLGNCPEFLFLVFGISKAGAVQVAVNTNHKGDLLQYFLAHSDSQVLVTEDQYLDRLAAVLPQTPKIKTVVVLDSPGTALASAGVRVLDWDSLVRNDGAYRPVDVLWSDPFGIMYTSGTTGPSKGALMPQNYALHMGDFCIKALEYTEEDCLYDALPLFHGNAQLLSFMPGLMSGARIVLAERFSAGAFWEDVRHYGCTEFNGIGGIIPILFKAEPRPDDADNPLQKIFTAATPREMHTAFERRFDVKIIEGYGMNEVGIPLIYSLSDRRPGTCGKLTGDYHVKIVDELGFPVGPYTPGEIWIRPLKPYSMMLEYYKMPEKTVEAWQQLWFHTGDQLSYDENGYYSFVDRQKDALRRRGENISSYEVEAIVNSHPAVLESAAVAVKSELGEDEVMICIVLKTGRTLAPMELMEFCQERMAYFMVPRYVRFMKALPKTPTEKTIKAELRKDGVTADTWDREQTGFRPKR
jgi:crotonobetaine/carnitine-CoA ligase